ncbi:MAG TPA: type II secretion system F family protein [Lacipirellulaceae bacterium]|jgi:tight adherence protein B|nr:type II secretion system F family protein [Lacipirellulaceae bacterium]
MAAIVISSLMVFVAVLLALHSGGAVWDEVTSRYVADITPKLDSLSLDHAKLPKYLRIWGISLVAVFVFVAFILRMPPEALAAVYLVYVSPRIILDFMIRKRRSVLRDQMVTATVALANTSRAGLSLAQGLESIGAETPEPLAAELRRIVHEYRHGRPLSEAIRATKDRLKIESFTLFSAAILVCLERGGRITDALERISHSLQELQRIERKLEVDTAAGTKVVYILTGFPILFLGISYITNPEGTGMLLHSISGQVILLFVIILTYLSFRWSQRILAIEV